MAATLQLLHGSGWGSSLGVPHSCSPRRRLAHRRRCCGTPPVVPPSPQKELDSLQREKDRIATTTVDDELAADPKLAEVRGQQGCLRRLR